METRSASFHGGTATADASGATEDKPGGAVTATARERHRGSGDLVEVEVLHQRIAAEVGEDRYKRYFADEGTKLTIEDGRVHVTVKSGFLAEFMDRRFGETIRRAARAGDRAGGPIELRFRVDQKAEPASSRSAKAAMSAPRPVPDARPARPARGQPVAIRYRLEDFVVGTANRLAHSAALRVAESKRGDRCGPLFIHGACGLGKTHLLQGLAGRFAALNPTATVRCIGAEEFTNEFITAVRNNSVDGFRRSYRAVDLLCLDDAHFLASKEKTQTELLHTFDAIDLSGARVVLASDDHPREIKRLSEQLVSRFMSGMVVRLDHPDTELRERIVRFLARRRGLEVEDAAVKLIAERSGRSIGTLGGFGGSVRELEGLLTQVEAVHRLLPEVSSADGVVGLHLVRRALGLSEQSEVALHSTPVRARRPIPVERITTEVCKSLGVPVSDMLGRGRHERVVLARSLTAYLSRKLTTLSFPEIARAMSRPNHSTVITACKRIGAQIDGPESEKADPCPLLPAEYAGMSVREFADRVAKDILRQAD